MKVVKTYTGLTIEIENFGAMKSLGCGSCGESLFEMQRLGVRVIRTPAS